jgi:Cd2+/Zn2+-exporting ATPase
VPIAVIAAISSAAKQGILIKGGTYLEAASGLKVIAFEI